MALTNVTTFDLEAAPGGSAPVINASQGDIGRQFQANLYWSGQTWTPGNGVTCKLRGHKPDNTVFEYTATISGSTVTFSTTEQMTIISGAVDCELVFTQSGTVIASANFVLQVEESPYDPNNLSESDVEGLTDVLAGFQRLNRDTNGVVKIGDGVTASETAEPITGFYVHDEETDTDGVAKVDAEYLDNVAGIADASFKVDNKLAPAGVVGEQFGELNKVVGAFGENRTVFSLANGTPPNPGNADAVRSTNGISVKQRDTVRVHTDRPVDDGYFYVYGFHEYTSSGTATTNIGYSSNRTTPYYSVYADAASSLKVAIAEVNSATNEYRSLRTSDFDGFSIWAEVVSPWNLSREVNGFVLDGSMVTVGTSNPNGYYVNEPTRLRNVGFIPVKKGMRIEFHAGEIIDGVYLTSLNSSGSAYSYRDFTDGDFHIVQEDGFVVSVFKNSKDSTTALLPAQYDAVFKILPVKQVEFLSLLNATRSTITPELRNGSVGNTGNATAVTMMYVLPIQKEYDTLTMRWIGDRDDGFAYAWYYILFKGVADGTTTTTAFTSDAERYFFNVNGDEQTNEPYLSLEIRSISNYDHIAVGLWIKNLATGTNEILRVPSNQFDIELDYSYGTNDIVQRNKGVEPVVNAASYYGHNGQGVANVNKQFSMLVTTDVHGDSTRFSSAIDYLNNMNSIDCGICLGDIVAENFSQSKDWYISNVNRSIKGFYTVLGNHDGGNSSDASISATVAEQVEAFIVPTRSKIGLSTLDKPYYAIYFADYKVALFVLDCYDLPDTKDGNGDFVVSRTVAGYSQAQMNWLQSELGNIPSDYSLVIAIHAVFEPHTVINNVWNNPNYDAYSSEIANYNYVGMLPELVNAWKTGGALSKTYAPANNSNLPTLSVNVDYSSRGAGKFVGYLAGHAHIDQIATVNAYDDQHIIVLDTTANDLWQNYWSDLPRAIGTKAEDCITVFVVDTSTDTFRLVRVGADETDALTERKTLVISY